MNAEKDLTYPAGRASMNTGEKPANLENEISALPSVQASREFSTPSGCHVRMFFKTEHDPSIRKEIARLLLAAFKQERNVDNETSNVSVQSFDEGAG